MQEVWKDIKGYEGRYQISSFGNVRRLYRYFVNKRIDEVKFLKPFFTNKDAYARINLAGKKIKIHILVWDHFGEGQRNGRMIQVDHINENKKNNSIYNLQLLTARANKSKERQSKRDLPTGVCFDKNRNKYVANIYYHGKAYFLGRYESSVDASQAYQKRLAKIERAA